MKKNLKKCCIEEAKEIKDKIEAGYKEAKIFVTETLENSEIKNENVIKRMETIKVKLENKLEKKALIQRKIDEFFIKRNEETIKIANLRQSKITDFFTKEGESNSWLDESPPPLKKVKSEADSMKGGKKTKKKRKRRKKTRKRRRRKRKKKSKKRKKRRKKRKTRKY